MGILLHYFLLISIFSLILPCICSAGFNPKAHQPESHVMDLFNQWKQTHGKSYKRVNEEMNRFESFKKNLEYIVEGNVNQTGYFVGLNRFADLSNEEFRAKYLGKVGLSQRKLKFGGSKVICDAPAYLDWRNKGVVAVVNDLDGELIILSEQELVDHDEFNHGYDGSQISKPFERTKNTVLNIDTSGNVEDSETALLCAVANKPISVGIDGSSIEFQLYTGGIYDGPCSSNPVDINHVALIVGYGSEGGVDYWIAKNSWGTTWGMNGYMHIRRNTNLPYGVCAINALAFYPIQTSLTPSPSSSLSLSPPPHDPTPQPSPPPLAPTSYPTPPPLLPSPPPAPIPTPSYNPPMPSPAAPSEPPSPPTPIPTPSYNPPMPSPEGPSEPPSPPTPIPTPSYNPPMPSPPAPSEAPSPPPPSPPPYHPPPPPSHKCGILSFCRPSQSCCCLYETFGFCLIQGCCEYANGVCCPESDYCCPVEYPICDFNAGLCLKNYEDNLGIDLKKKAWAKLTLPWSEYEESKENTYQSLKWRRHGSA